MNKNTIFEATDGSDRFDKLEHEDVIRAAGIEIRIAGEDELQLDCDNGFDRDHARRILDRIYRKLGTVIRITEVRESSSGPGHCHVYLKADRPLPIWVKPALQVMLGSSIDHELHVIRQIHTTFTTGGGTGSPIKTYGRGWKKVVQADYQ